MADETRPPFEDFDAKLGQARSARAAADPARDEPARLDWGSGLQIGVELLAGLLGGVLLGYGLDAWLGTKPLFIIVFFLLGSVAGMLNAYRHLRRLQAKSAL